MRIFRNLSEIPNFEHSVLTQGTYDGVHLGHKEVLKQVVSLAKFNNSPSILLTFYPHPRLVIYPDDNQLRLLQTIDEKASELEKTGIDNLVVLPFTGKIAALTAQEFIQDILVQKFNINNIVVGYDHHFGKNRAGNLQLLKDYGLIYNFSVSEISAQNIDHITISSTKIRNALLEGRIAEANSLLGRYYSIEGKVVTGKQIGRTIGFPTANLQVFDPYKLIPRIGVYAAFCVLDNQKFMAAVNIGFSPTIEGKGFSIEAYILNFNEFIYDKHIKLELVQFLRDEYKFQSIDELKDRINLDVAEAQNILRSV